MRNKYVVTRSKDSLAHFGILGQKKGVRRFQNEDGTLTEEGKRRYGSAASALTNVSKGLDTASKLTELEQKSKIIRPDYANVSDEELKKKVARLSLEEQYGRLTGDIKKVRSGSDWVHEILQTGSILASMAGTAVSVYIALKALKGGKIV
jgi:hypothetical protein